MSALSHEFLWVIPVSVFVAGIIGSPHCLSMCGPLVLNFARTPNDLLAYQIARMIAYTTVGAIVGAFGSVVLAGVNSTWLSTISIMSISLLLIVNGYRAWVGKPLHFVLPTFLNRSLSSIWRHAKVSRDHMWLNAAMAGFFTVLLPCGHLYSFLLGAVATGSSGRGAAYMFAFWLGSTPLLSVSSQLLRKLIASNLPNRQRWAGVLLMVAGLFSAFAFGFKSEKIAGGLRDCHHVEK